MGFQAFKRATKAKTAPRQPKTGQDRQKALKKLLQDRLKTASRQPKTVPDRLKTHQKKAQDSPIFRSKT